MQSLIVTSTPTSLRALRAVFKTLAPGTRWEQETTMAARVDQLVAENIPAPLAAACRAWLEDDGVLVLACANGAVAAKLKQLVPRLQLAFHAAEGQIRSIIVEVQASTAPPAQAQKKSTRLPPPPSAAADLEAVAAQVKAPALALAMRRLATHLRGGER
ncbi:MAG: DUF721 domain-containing protein [Pseudomonadota bacterium]|nr:DUF721 domain-containing protein [Pseudomonadota bacterium]